MYNLLVVRVHDIQIDLETLIFIILDTQTNMTIYSENRVNDETATAIINRGLHDMTVEFWTC